MQRIIYRKSTFYFSLFHCSILPLQRDVTARITTLAISCLIVGKCNVPPSADTIYCYMVASGNLHVSGNLSETSINAEQEPVRIMGQVVNILTSLIHLIKRAWASSTVISETKTIKCLSLHFEMSHMVEISTLNHFNTIPHKETAHFQVGKL